MQFSETWQSVLDGTKTATSRLVKPGEVLQDRVALGYPPCVFTPMRSSNLMRIRYEVGQCYAVQPGRGQRAVARIQITSIARRDVRTYTDEDAATEGFPDLAHFLVTWVRMHDKKLAPLWDTRRTEVTYSSMSGVRIRVTPEAFIERVLSKRPAARYDAWFLRFELVKE